MRQPVDKLKGRVPQKLLKKNLVFFLKRRTAASCGAQELLPSMIRGIATGFMHVSSDKSPAVRTEWIEKIAEVIAECVSHASVLAVAPTMKRRLDCRADVPGCNALFVAIELED